MTFVRVLPTNPSDDDLKRTTLAKERALRAEDIERALYLSRYNRYSSDTRVLGPFLPFLAYLIHPSRSV